MRMRQTIQSVNDVATRKIWVRPESGSRRVVHGGMAWANRGMLMQPQDGAFDSREQSARVTDIGKRLQVAAFGAAAMVEPEDARLTGGTRTLVRRLLGLNITPRVRPTGLVAKAAKPVAAKPAKRILAAAVDRAQVA